MSLSVLTVGDPHFKKNNASDMIKVTEQITALIDQYKPDLVVNLGDTLDSHDTANSDPFSRSYHFHKAIHDRTNLAIIVGNHDLPNNETWLSDKHFMLYLNEWSRATVAGQSVQVIKLKGHRICLAPYVEPGRFDELLKTNPDYDDDVRVIFCHQEFRGAHYGSGKSTKGDPWSPDRPLVISGHIHDYQLCQDNIVYVGTPIAHTFGKERAKTVSLFTFDQSGKYSQRKFKLDIPNKVKLNLNVEQALKVDLKDNVRYKIIIDDTDTKILAFQKTHQYMELKKRLGNNLKCLRKTITKSKVKKRRIELTYVAKLRRQVTEPREQAIYCKVFGKPKAIFRLQNLKRNSKTNQKVTTQS